MAEIGKLGKKAEALAAQRLGGSVRKGSGCGPIHKGDITLGEYLIEHKATEKGSLSVRYEWLTKITNEALGLNKTPALQIVFMRGDGNPKPSGSWVMVPEWHYRELISDD